jgi:hypothetical protein
MERGDWSLRLGRAKQVPSWAISGRMLDDILGIDM